MRNFKALSLFGLLCWCTSQAFGQTIRGEVYDRSTQSPVKGASITLPNSKKGVTSDAAGKFSLEANGAHSISISSVGYKPLALALTDTAFFRVELESFNQSLEQAVVVGYGTQRKANLTGAVSTVDVNKTFQSKPINDPTKALQGIVPGLTIVYGNGGLTSGADIKIRGIGSINGSSRPLILVDNVQTDDLSIINPNDIESISVLKDAASSSIYGARAAFGVVLIKTKSGRKNQRTSVTYSNNFSWNKFTKLPDFSDPVPELTGLNDAAVRAGLTPETFGMNLLKLRDGIANWQKNYSGNTSHEMTLGQDWDTAGGRTYFYKVWDPKKEILNKYTSSQIHSISISGGSEKIGYYVSGGYSNDGGIFKMNPDNVKKYNITAGITATVTDWLDVRIKTLYRNYSYDYPYQYQNYWYYLWRWGSYFPYGTYQGNYFRVNSAYLAGASKANLSDNYNRIDLGATVKITKNLSFNADYTIGRDNTVRHEVSGPIQAWDFWTAGKLALSNIATASQDAVAYTSGRLLVNTFNGYGTYNKSFGDDHHMKVIAGINAESDENINFTAARRGLLDPSQGELGLTYADQTSGPSGSNVPLGWSTNGHGKLAYAGYFGRVNYDYKGKYLLELNGRYDGSSTFSPDNRWSFFSSGSAGYRISEEEFMQSLKPVLADAKIRASYGSVGNQDLGGQYFLRRMTGIPTTAIPVNWMNGTNYAGSITQPAAVANSLEWEKVTTLDLGTDVRLFDYHIGLSFDWYQRDTRGMVQPVSEPATFGVTGPYINAGNFRNQGYEISMDANYSIGKAQIYGVLSLADGKTTFTKWSNPNLSISNATGINYIGKTYGEIWGFETDRYFTANDFNPDGTTKSNIASQKTLQGGNFVYGPGDIKFKDLNGDGKIDGGKSTLTDHGDLKVIGNTQPRYQYSARVGGFWNNFDLDIFVQGIGKRQWWGIGNTILPMYQSLDILYANQLDYWTPDRTNARYPKLYPNNQTGTVAGISAGGNNFYPQTKYLLNLAYCRLKNVTLGYTLPMQLLSRYKIQKFRVYVSGENLAEISNVGAPIDPEITDGESNFTGRTWPFMRSYSVGVQLTF